MDKLEYLFKEVLIELGLNIKDPDLKETPKRISKMYKELFNGLYCKEPDIKVFPNTEKYNELVAVKNIKFYSNCSHHFLPFFGVCHIGYLPKTKLLGLSKFARIVEHFSRRPQLQERLTCNIADFLMAKLKPQGCIVVMEANHLCMELRGVRKENSKTITSAIRGKFEYSIKEEFLKL